MATSPPKKLKIAVLVRNFVITGGAERYTYHISRRLAEQHDVHIFCQRWDEALIAGLTIHQIPRPLPRPSFVNLLLFSWFCDQVVDDSFDIIYSNERVRRFDVLSIHCPCYRGFLTKSRGIKKALLWLRELTSPRGLAYLWLEKGQYSDHPGRFLIADSQMVKDDVLHNYPQLPTTAIGVAYPGVDLEEVDQALADTDPAQVRQQYGLPEGQLNLLFVGTEFKRKGLDALLKGFSKLKETNIQLLVAGAGDIKTYKQQARDLGIEDKVTFLGKVGDIYPLYIMADIFILPTLSDPCPIAPLEAMSFGTPTIMSSAPYCGTAEHVQQGEAIILADPRDSNEIQQAITQLLEPQRRQQLSKLGHELGRRLGWEHTTKLTLDAFERISSERMS